MTTYPTPLARLSQELSKLPGIGEKSAARLAFHLLKGKKEDVFSLADSIGKLRKEVGLCRSCFGFTEVDPLNGEAALCAVCRSLEREQDKICVVEEPSDLIAVEKSREVKGLYHVLHGRISPLGGIGADARRLQEPVEGLSSGKGQEDVVAS